jgi:hypothetical protein
MRRGQQQTITLHPSHSPDQHHGGEAEEVDDAPERNLLSKLRARAHHEKRLQRRNVRGCEQRERLRHRATSRGSTLAGKRQPPFKHVRLRRAPDRVRRHTGQSDRPDIGQPAPLIAIAHQKAEQLAGRKATIVLVSENRSERGFEQGSISYRVQVDDLRR